MIANLNPKQRRAAALLILLALLAAIVTGIALPIWTTNAGLADDIAEAEDRLQRLRRLAAARAPLQARYEAAARHQANNAYYLKSTSEALAVAELQGIAKRAIDSNGGTILSTQSLPFAREAGLVRVSVRITMKGDLAGLRAAFYQFETGQPMLFLDDVSIRPNTGSKVRRRLFRQQTVPGDLDMNFELSGFMRGEGP